jgi:hypothetical protein
MARDSFYGETILWTGKPEVIRTPLVWKVASIVAGVMSLTSVAFAIVVASAIHRPVGPMLLLSAWCATIALGAWKGPQILLAKVTYQVTDKHIVWRRGRLRRAIERAGVSYAVLRWTDREGGIGDLLLTRAVPTGALRRTLSLTLTGVKSPDRVFSLVRGVSAPELVSAPGLSLEAARASVAARPLAQRLDPGERVLWSATPLASPWTVRRGLRAALAVALSLALVRMLVRAVPSLGKLLRLHALPGWTFGLMLGAMAVVAILLLVSAFVVGWSALVLPWKKQQRTRYFVTNKRVLIARDDEELHLERSRIAYVIASKGEKLHDVFLVLDGPHARSLALSGAFGGDDGGVLRPVFNAIDDADSVHDLLAQSEKPAPMRDAA